MSESETVRIDVLTIFPELIAEFCNVAMLGAAQRDALLDLRLHDLRAVTTDVHRSVDDAPYGGGAGMVLSAAPIFDTVDAVDPPRPLFYLSPAGRRFDQQMAEELCSLGAFSLLCGRYEGVDERVRTDLVDGEISIGDVVLAGGEVAALLVIEAVARLIPGVLGNAESIGDESFQNGLLEYPQYTRPAEYRGLVVPAVLRSGDHAQVARWRRAQSLRATLRSRPDLIAAAGGISAEDTEVLAEFANDDQV